MVKQRRGGWIGLGLILGLFATLAIAAAASANHWPDYNGSADSHELVAGNPELCEQGAGGTSFRIDGSQLAAGQEYPAGNPVVRITAVDVDGGTLSWALVDGVLNQYDMAVVVMKGGDNAEVYHYDSSGAGVDDSDSGITTPINDNGAAPDRPYGISHVDFCLDPKSDTGVDRLVVTKTASTSWEKVYTWSVDKSVDKNHLEMKTGSTGSVQWKVDVTQTGSTARNAVVSGTITVQNPNGTAVSGVSVSDALSGAVVDCDSATAGAQSTGLTAPANGSIECSYSAGVATADGGTNTATATGTLNGVDVSDSGTADYAFGEPTVEINKTVHAEDGLNEWDGITGTTSFTYGETFDCSDKGRTNVVDLLGDNPDTEGVETDYLLDTASAGVTVHCSSNPPPPPPPPPHGPESMDVQIVKDATQQVQLVNGQADIAYSLVVRNNGPNQAHNVVVSDAAPSGVTFLAVTTQPVDGSCTVTSALLNCSLGTLGPGVFRTIGVSARVTQTGTYSNCATVSGEGGDTNSANNTDCAETVVTAPATQPVTPPFTPPVKPTPKPKPKPNLCRVLTIKTKLVKANGHRHGLVAKVTRSRNAVKGVKVRFTGAGVSKSARTNAKGVAHVTIKTTKAGIIHVRITNAKACNTARIGVVGVFQPPVTG
jgi:uncharacterized repeat protein (TIGR01451 family)